MSQVADMPVDLSTSFLFVFSFFRVFVILLMHSDGFVDNAMPSVTHFSRPSCPIQNSGLYEID